MKTRTIAFAVAVAAAMLVPAPAASALAPIGVEDNSFAPARVSTTVADSDVSWVWDLDGSTGGTTDNEHNVVSEDGLFGSDLVQSGSFERVASAGGFPYFCVLHVGMEGRLQVAPEAAEPRGARPFKVRWAPRGANTGSRYDVSFKAGGGPWKVWLEDTREKANRFGAGEDPVELEKRTKYSFRARSQAGGREDERSGWSPTVRART
jgi:plastocyanin